MSTRNKTEIAADEISVAEGTMILGIPRHQLMALIQRREIRGRFDPTRHANSGRWFCSRRDLERWAKETGRARNVG